MHEISLVQNLVQQLKELAEENKATKILTVTMEIGPLCGVVVDSFRFGFDIITAEEEFLRGAQLVVEVPPVAYSCSGCGQVTVSAAARPEYCPNCRDTTLFANGGDDLILRRVELE